jgi:hypothetical protein
MIWVLGFAALAFATTFLYRRRRQNRARMILAFTERFPYATTDESIARIDRRIGDSLQGISLGGLVGALVQIIVLVVVPAAMQSGLAGAAGLAVLVGFMAAGSALAAYREAAKKARSATDASARASLFDYLHPAWVIVAGLLSAASATMAVVLLLGVGTAGADAALLFPVVVGLAVVAFLAVVTCTIMSRGMLVRPGDELDPRWADALRAADLRDLWVSAIGFGAAAFVATAEWFLPGESPWRLLVGLLGFAPLVLLSLPASRRTDQRLAHTAG